MIPDPRGQTTLDFTIGVTIFVIVLTGVFLFVPGTLQPFEQGNQEDIVTVNRVANNLAEQSLGESTSPYVLDGNRTVTFFNGSNLYGQVGLGDFQFANVTLQASAVGTTGNAEILCWNGTRDPGDRVVAANDSSCDTSDGDTRLAAGNTPAEDRSSVTARRVVELDGRDVFLVVELW